MASKLKIRKGDRVKVIAGRSKGKVRRRAARAADRERVVVPGVNVIKRHTKPSRTEQPAASSSGRPRSTSRTWPCSIRRSDKPTKVGFKFLEDGRKVRFARALRRNNRPLGERAMPARLQEHYTKTVREALTKEFCYKNPFEVPKLDKIVINMGVGEAVNDRKAVDARGGRPDGDHRPEAGDDQVAQVDRDLQAARGHADRRQGHAAPRPHVRVPRPADHHRPAARPRLPRR